MKFYLGTHEPSWLRRVDVPLFVSRRRLARLQQLPVAAAPWALDSGGFTELALHGGFCTTADEYVSAVRLYADTVGRMEWAAPQDWMCEPWMVAKTGLSVVEHQRRTVASVIRLRQLGSDLPFIPVLQGWRRFDYEQHVDMYAAAGIDLCAERLVGLGSVCRRQSTDEIADLARTLHDGGIRLHGFGVKTLGLKLFGSYLASADSMAWSYNARRNPPIDGHTHTSCSNCLPFALRWRQRVLLSLTDNNQHEGCNSE